MVVLLLTDCEFICCPSLIITEAHDLEGIMNCWKSANIN